MSLLFLLLSPASPFLPRFFIYFFSLIFFPSFFFFFHPCFLLSLQSFLHASSLRGHLIPLHYFVSFLSSFIFLLPSFFFFLPSFLPTFFLWFYFLFIRNSFLFFSILFSYGEKWFHIFLFPSCYLFYLSLFPSFLLLSILSVLTFPILCVLPSYFPSFLHSFVCFLFLRLRLSILFPPSSPFFFSYNIKL